MDDPFGLLEIAKAPKEDKHKTFPKKAYLTIISVLLVLVLAMVALSLFNGSSEISADTDSASSSIKITNLPNEVKTGQSINFNLVFSNKDEILSDGYVLINGVGVNLSRTIDAAKNIKSGEAGYTRKLTDDEHLRFDQNGDSGIYYQLGTLAAHSTKSLQTSAIVTTGAKVPAQIEVKLFKPKRSAKRCGFLNLKRCYSTVGDTQIASAAFQIEPTDVGNIKLRSGFNFVSLPYVFTAGSLSQFFSSLTTKWAYVYDPTTAGYIDLNQADNSSRIKPGAAFWLYDKNGGEYELPQEKVETNSNETYSIPLAIGWNQVGNPYSRRMVLSGSKLSIHELSDDGSQSGTSYDLKTAITNGTLSDPYFIVYPNSTSSAITTLKALLDSTVEPFSGFLIKANKKVNLVIPGKEVITAGDNLSAQERSKIEGWISENGLNQYGDPSGTVYAGGTPLYNQITSQTVDRFDYLLEKHPDRPWNK